MAIPLDGQALLGLYALRITVVPDSDSRVACIPAESAACDGDHCYIRESDARKFFAPLKKAGDEINIRIS